MPTVCPPDVASGPRFYEESTSRWDNLWNSMDVFTRELHGWTTPWLDMSMRDGNPIFSAWSPSLHQGLRIIQHGDPGTFTVRRNTFAKGTRDAVDELVVDCALTDDHLRNATRIVASWLKHCAEDSRRRSPFVVDCELDMDYEP